MSRRGDSINLKGWALVGAMALLFCLAGWIEPNDRQQHGTPACQVSP